MVINSRRREARSIRPAGCQSGAVRLAVRCSARYERIEITRDIDFDAKTVPHIAFERDLEAGRAPPMAEEGRYLLVGDEDRGTRLDVVGIGGMSAKHLDALRA